MNRVWKRQLPALLLFSLASGVCSAQAPTRPIVPFPDVPKDHWAYQAVMELQQKGILVGYPDGTFHGEKSKHSPSPVKKNR